MLNQHKICKYFLKQTLPRRFHLISRTTSRVSAVTRAPYATYTGCSGNVISLRQFAVLPSEWSYAPHVIVVTDVSGPWIPTALVKYQRFGTDALRKLSWPWLG